MDSHGTFWDECINETSEDCLVQIYDNQTYKQHWNVCILNGTTPSLPNTTISTIQQLSTKGGRL